MVSHPTDALEPQNHLVWVVACYHELLTSVRAVCADLADKLATDTIIKTGEELQRIGAGATDLEKRVAECIEVVQIAGDQ